jgi:tRNA(Ile)-lysidine synthase
MSNNNSLARPFPEVAAFFESLGASLSAPVSVAVGVSGGADSVALLHILNEYGDEFGIGRLTAAHVNHGLRGAESDGDEAFVRGEADRLGVEFFSVRLDGVNKDNIDTGTDTVDALNDIDRDDFDGGIYNDGNNVEAWARRERYRFFSEVRQRHGMDWVATAHTANDQAETVLMRLARGAGLRGLRGILPVRGDGVIRPLLGVERRRLLEWLSARGIGHREDSSNADLNFRRNRVRAEVIPKLAECYPAAAVNIAAAAAGARAAWAAIEGRAGEWIREYVLTVSPEVFHIEKAGFAAEPATAREALLMLFDGHGILPTRLHIERAAAALASGERYDGREHLLPGGWKFYCRDDRVCFVKKNQRFIASTAKPSLP